MVVLEPTEFRQVLTEPTTFPGPRLHKLTSPFLGYLLSHLSHHADAASAVP